jgi:predicted anti-sigma-YlaC factor YlaD
MECCKWEELGLLYSSGELDRKHVFDFEEHLKECEECRKELYYYRAEKKRFFTADMLGLTPSPEVDDKILLVCSDVHKKRVSFTLMPAFLRKAVMPVALFAMAFVSVGYIILNMENANQMKSAAIKTQPEQSAIQSAAVQPSFDSAADSTKGLNNNFAKSRGNLEGQGVIPVDLKNK